MQAIKSPEQQQDFQKKQQTYQDTGTALMVLIDTLREMTTEVYKVREERESSYQGKNEVEQEIKYLVTIPQRIADNLGVPYEKPSKENKNQLILPEIEVAAGTGSGKDEIDAEIKMRTEMFKNLLSKAIRASIYEVKVTEKELEIEALNVRIAGFEKRIEEFESREGQAKSPREAGDEKDVLS